MNSLFLALPAVFVSPISDGRFGVRSDDSYNHVEDRSSL